MTLNPYFEQQQFGTASVEGVNHGLIRSIAIRNNYRLCIKQLQIQVQKTRQEMRYPNVTYA